MDVHVAEIQATRGEKLLALVLTAFLFLGGIWAYSRLHVSPGPYPSGPAVTAADQRAIARLQTAERGAGEAAQREAASRSELELRREAYRTALDAGRPAEALRLAYVRADRDHDRAAGALREAEAAVDSARPAAELAAGRRDAASERLAEEYEADRRHTALVTFGLRLALLLGLLAAAYLVFARLRTSRYAPVGGAALGAVTLLALAGGADYLDDYVEWQALGPLLLSLVGIALTLLAFAALQRQLARRLPLRRIRKGECPYCGFPDRGNERCEGCGNSLRLACNACASRRRVGAPHCGACGSA